MKRSILTQRLARESGVTKAEAADRLDVMVHKIIVDLRKGKDANLPGLGKFRPGKPWTFQFEQESDARK